MSKKHGKKHVHHHFVQPYPIVYQYPNEGQRRGTYFYNLAQKEYATGSYVEAYRHIIVALTYFTDVNMNPNTLKQYWDLAHLIEKELDLDAPPLKLSDVLV